MNKTIRRATTKDLIAITQLIAPFIDEFAINDSGRQLFCVSMIEKMERWDALEEMTKG